MKLTSLLPFLDNDDLKEIVEKIKNKEIKGVKFVHLYPFLDTKEVDELVDELLKDGNAKQVYSALPFMSEARLNKLNDQVTNGEVEGIRQEALLPFLGKDKIKDLVNDLIKKSVDEKLEGLEDEISERVEKAVENAFDDE